MSQEFNLAAAAAAAAALTHKYQQIRAHTYTNARVWHERICVRKANKKCGNVKENIAQQFVGVWLVVTVVNEIICWKFNVGAQIKLHMQTSCTHHTVNTYINFIIKALCKRKVYTLCRRDTCIFHELLY